MCFAPPPAPTAGSSASRPPWPCKASAATSPPNRSIPSPTPNANTSAAAGRDCAARESSDLRPFLRADRGAISHLGNAGSETPHPNPPLNKGRGLILRRLFLDELVRVAPRFERARVGPVAFQETRPQPAAF